MSTSRGHQRAPQAWRNRGERAEPELEAIRAHLSSDAFPAWPALIEGEQLGTLPERSPGPRAPRGGNVEDVTAVPRSGPAG